MHKSQSKGKSAEILFELLCLKKDWHCCKPITDSMQYDYIIDRGSGFEKIQVKTSYFDKNKKTNRCDLRRSIAKGNGRAKYKEGDFDAVAINVDFNRWIIIPWEVINKNTEISLTDRRITNEPTWHVHFEP
jgi:hypothetical protein